MPSWYRASCAHLLLIAALAVGCGENDPDDDIGSTDAGLDAGLGAVRKYEGTLVAAFDASVIVSVPHEVTLLDGNGNALNPPVSTTSGPEGEVRFEVPANAASIYIVGVGPTDDIKSTYDTVVVNFNWASQDALLRISSRATLNLAAQTSGFEVRSDRASMSGVLYWTSNGVRRGAIGCATVFLDGANVPDEDQAQRYTGTALPLPLAEQPETSRLGGFYFGNIKVGVHSLRVSVDDGQTVLALKSFFVGRPRSGAQSPTKSILYQLSVEIEAPADPTPARCPEL